MAAKRAITKELKQIQSTRCFGGTQAVYEHTSKELNCQMKFAIYFPSITSEKDVKLPVVYFLSGLTCTHENMMIKSGFQRYAEQYQLIVVGPDTSPRGCRIPGEDEDWDLGTGAGFYVDATQPPWNKHYRMYSYITKELREVVDRNFKCLDGTRIAITGHSMGGHGALVCFLRNPQLYKAVSAFAPISNPSKSHWGRKCMTAYLGTDEAAWKEYDATELVKRQPQKNVNIVVEQGDRDEWLSYLLPKNFVEACQSVGQPVEYNERADYDHGYFFVSTFIGDHLKRFADILKK